MFKHEEENNEANRHHILGRAVKLSVEPREIESFKSHYQVSLWRMHQGTMPLMISTLDMTSTDDFKIYND
jgi:hypothetical protein